jgi:hypothetical protein
MPSCRIIGTAKSRWQFTNHLVPSTSR